MRIVNRIRRGLRYSEKYGSHPGTAPLVAFVLLGAVAGGIIGAGIMLAVFGPFYLLGAYERGQGEPQESSHD